MICNCCGNPMEDTPEENMDYGTGKRDVGYGTCMKCAEWATDRFFAAQKHVFRNALNAKNQAIWDAMSDEDQKAIFFGAVEEGVIK